MRLSLVTAPSEEPLTLAEAKLHCRVDISDDDALITRLIVAVRRNAEARIRRSLVTQTWDLYLDDWPGKIQLTNLPDRAGLTMLAPTEDATDGGFSVEIPKPPLQSVTYVKYYDMGGTLVTMDSSLYTVSPGSPGRVMLAPSQIWPQVQTRRADAVNIRFVSGFGAASAVWEDIKCGMLLHIGTLYKHRESVTEGSVNKVPDAVDTLYRSAEWGFYA